jgi:hypothetical protein
MNSNRSNEDISWCEQFRVVDIMSPKSIGRLRLEKFDVIEDTVFPEWYSIPTPLGAWIRLMQGGLELMSDEPNNTVLLREPVERCEGRVLLSGMGLGCMIRPLLSKPSVISIDVVELSPSVIDLVGPHYWLPSVRIFHGNAMEPDAWAPDDAVWDTAFHDIWVIGGVERYPQQIRMMDRYANRVRSWQGSAWFEELEQAWLQGKRTGWPDP